MMTFLSARLHPRRGVVGLVGAFFVGLFVLLSPVGAHAQVSWELDPTTSLVWWQIDPHYNHLWATTCPDDPSWQAGEGRSSEFRYVFDPGLIDAGKPSAVIPLYPRGPVRALCRPAVRGAVTVRDTVSWRDVSGSVAVLGDSLVTGLNIRDFYAHRWLLETRRYPEIRFQLDSLSGVQQGDTLRAVAHGVFEVRDVPLPVAVPISVTRGRFGIRIVGQTSFPAIDLVKRFGMSRIKLGMGVAMKRWEEVYWGFDLLLKEPNQS